jgi:hypothetical protein
MEELLEAVFSVRLVPRQESHLDKHSQSAVYSESEYEVGVRWSPACEVVSPVAEERLPLEATT